MNRHAITWRDIERADTERTTRHAIAERADRALLIFGAVVVTLLAVGAL